MDLSEIYEDDISPYSKPCTQFVFRGEETVEGDATKKVRTLSEDHQYIYENDDHVAWTDLQVWIGTLHSQEVRWEPSKSHLLSTDHAE
jgi:hypothetical protein